MKQLFLSLILLILFTYCSSQGVQKHKPAQGKFFIELTSDSAKYVTKTVYNETDFYVLKSQNKDKCKFKGTVNLRILIIGVYCKGLFSTPDIPSTTLRLCFDTPEACVLGYPGIYLKTTGTLACDKPTIIPSSNDWKPIAQTTESPPTPAATTTTTEKAKEESKRDADQVEAANPEEAKKTTTTTVSSTTTTAKPQNDKHKVARAPFMGEYIMIFDLEGLKENPEEKPAKRDDSEEDNGSESSPASIELEVRMRSPVGFLSADEYPMQTFYLVMCIVYVLFSVAWLVMSACNYHDLLRVQFWIGGVILLGLIEKAVHYSEYLNVNNSGISEMGTEKFAAFVACVKRTVARMLVIIVSLGFGIVKPRLGPTLHRVIGIGLVYFIIALLEQMLAIDVYFNEGSREAWLFMYIPLALIDSIICYWIFMSLLQTMKTLRLRRNTTKLSLYRHFANTIVFCVIISVIMMLWAIHYHEQRCNKDFANAWFEDACWPMLFSVILFVTMILWRPNANNQRYAYSPMIDGNGSDDEDVEEPMLGSGATETMKMRGSKKIVRSDVDRTEEDLKWIEENIPQTVADAAVPVLLDSDEEQMSTKYEMSKME